MRGDLGEITSPLWLRDGAGGGGALRRMVS